MAMESSDEMPKPHGIRLRCPFSMIISGQSQSGKTTFVRNLLERWGNICGNMPSTMFWLYGQQQSELFCDLKSMTDKSFEFIEGFDIQKLKECLPRAQTAVVVLDDLNREAFSEPFFASLFDRVCHHNRCNAVAISQNLFDPGKYFRHAMLNATYLVLLSSARDKRSLTFLNSQIFPGKKNFLTDAYNDAVEKRPYGHLIIDSIHQLAKCRICECAQASLTKEQIYYLTHLGSGNDRFDFINTFTNA